MVVIPALYKCWRRICNHIQKESHWNTLNDCWRRNHVLVFLALKFNSGHNVLFHPWNVRPFLFKIMLMIGQSSTFIYYLVNIVIMCSCLYGTLIRKLLRRYIEGKGNKWDCWELIKWSELLIYNSLSRQLSIKQDQDPVLLFLPMLLWPTKQ